MGLPLIVRGLPIKKLLSAERGGSSWLLGILRTRTRGIVSPGSLLRHRFYISGPPTTAPEYVPEYVPEDAGDPEDVPEYAGDPEDVPEYRHSTGQEEVKA